jgi:crossover junction endodeoxyribonuclease RuvC
MSASGKSGRIRVLGVDPAAAGATGYAVVESNGGECRSLHYGALKVADKIRRESAGAVLKAVHSVICDLLREFSPDALAVESIFSALNVKTALRLAEVRGVVLLAAAQYDIEVHSYAPRLIKASVAGYGHADKRQLQLMVRSLLGLTEIPEPADAADALAVALCHLQSAQFRARFLVPVDSGAPRRGPRVSKVQSIKPAAERAGAAICSHSPRPSRAPFRQVPFAP